VPSPKVQLQEIAPTPPLMLAEKLLGEPASLGFGLAVIDDTAKAATTVMDFELVAISEGVDESAAVTLTLKIPLALYVWVEVIPDPVLPSPKDHAKETGAMQLVVEAVKVTGEVVSGVAGPKTRLTLHWGAAVIFTAMLCDIATPRLSVTVTVAVKLPAVL
jgi:hypothetical protein